ncbi:MAG TPA: hypothetical protein VM869_19200 [Enhygromyxa sp.]|jgi:hypothetical protein|nr:hypothetical protein [Enhygromyxa sp.]
MTRTRTALAITALLLATAACTKEEICFPWYQKCPGEETGDTGESEPEYSCFDNGGLEHSWCVEDISALERQAVSAVLAVAPGPWGTADFDTWDPLRECLTPLVEHECVMSVLNVSKKCTVCWTEEGTPDWQAATLTGPVAVVEWVENGEVVRFFDHLGWYDATMTDAGLDEESAVCQKVRTHGVRTGAECLCTADNQCPQLLGEGICEQGVCIYTNIPDASPTLEPGPHLYGLSQWSDGLSCTGNTCTLTSTLIGNLHVLVTWWDDEVEWSVNPTTGYITIDSLHGDSLPYQLGLRQGDVITAINGQAPTASTVNNAIDTLLRSDTVAVALTNRTIILTM